MTDEESTEVIGRDRESHQRDLYEAIERGEYPQWRMCIQVMTEVQAQAFRWNPFDITKVWPHAEYPLIEVGTLDLNRNPENYHAEVEQSAFSPSSLVPGIEPSPDKMLQARLMSYADAHRYRVGTNYQQLPVNRPRCPFATYQRDGAMATAENYGSQPNYFPNSEPSTPVDDARYKEAPMPLGHVTADRYDSRVDHDDFSQAGALWRLLGEEQQDRTAKAIAGGLSQARHDIQMRQLCHFFRADPTYGQKVADASGIEVPEDML